MISVTFRYNASSVRTHSIELRSVDRLNVTLALVEWQRKALMIAINQPTSKGRYEPGELVRHRRYGYRGVVVAVDEGCEADDEWYQKNQTQPNREQAWHHVLVDGSGAVTYAAGENLLLDSSESPIDHPLVTVFFACFDRGRYVRNDRPWPAI